MLHVSHQVSWENDDYDEESSYLENLSELETSQERIQREFCRNAFQTEKRLTETRSEGSLEELRARRINSTPATQGRVSDGSMPLQLDPFASYTFNRDEEMRQYKRSLSAPNITVEFDDGISVHSVFIDNTSHSNVSINSRDDNSRLPPRSGSGRGLHIKIRDKEDSRRAPIYPGAGSTYEYTNIPERKSVCEINQDKEEGRRAPIYPGAGSTYYEYTNIPERKSICEKNQEREAAGGISIYGKDSSEYYEYLKRREKKSVLEKNKDRETVGSITDYPEEVSEYYDHLKHREKKSVWKKIQGAFKRKK